MRRILRNYLISFVIIALLAIVVTLIDHWADKKESRTNSAQNLSPSAQMGEPAISNPTAVPPRSAQ